MTRILIAPDSFKGTATAVEVAQAIRQGWQTVRPDDEVSLAPMADGGEGTIEAFSIAYPVRVDAGHLHRTRRRPVPTHWLLLPDGPGSSS